MQAVENIYSKFRDYLKNEWILKLILIILSLICYVNIFQNGLSFDDRDFLENWQSIKSTDELPAIFHLPSLLAGDTPFWHRGVYRPIRGVYYLVTNSIWGENLFGYHLQAILVHILITQLVFLIAKNITKNSQASFFTSSLFAVHPIQTEAITFLTASFDSLGVLFFFLSFYFYIKRYETGNKSGVYLAGSLVYGLLAFFTYEITLVLPILIILYDRLIRKDGITLLLEKFRVYRHFFAMVLFYLGARFVLYGVGDRSILGLSQIGTNYQGRIGMAEVWLEYLKVLIIPSQITLLYQIPIRLMNQIFNFSSNIDPTGKIFDLIAKNSLIFVILYFLLITFAAFKLLKKYPVAAFGVLWFFASLLPVSNIFPQGAVLALRFLYIPSFGYFLVIGFLLHRIFGKINRNFKLIIPIFFVSLLVFYSYKTILRNRDWKDEKSIWIASIKINPNVSTYYSALASKQALNGEYDEAIESYKKALEFTQDNTQLYSDIGKVYLLKADYTSAAQYQKKAIESNPEYLDSYAILGDLYFKEKDYQNALENYTILLSKNFSAENLIKLGDTYYNLKDYKNAILSYKKVVFLYPDSIIAYFKIGSAYYYWRKFELAKIAFEKCLSLDPEQPQVYISLSKAYRKLGDEDSAIKILLEGLKKTDSEAIKGELYK